MTKDEITRSLAPFYWEYLDAGDYRNGNTLRRIVAALRISPAKWGKATRFRNTTA